jgi:hypothetical protein
MTIALSNNSILREAQSRLEPDAMLGCRLFGRLPGVALIHIGQFNVCREFIQHLCDVLRMMVKMT